MSTSAGVPTIPVDPHPDAKTLLLVDGHHGIYVPQRFVERYLPARWGISEEDVEALRQGPDSAHYKDHYWDTWDRVLSNTKGVNVDGHIWTLHQDGDLWAVRDDLTDEEKEAFYG